MLSSAISRLLVYLGKQKASQEGVPRQTWLKGVDIWYKWVLTHQYGAQTRG